MGRRKTSSRYYDPGSQPQPRSHDHAVSGFTLQGTETGRIKSKKLTRQQRRQAEREAKKRGE